MSENPSYWVTVFDFCYSLWSILICRYTLDTDCVLRCTAYSFLLYIHNCLPLETYMKQYKHTSQEILENAKFTSCTFLLIRFQVGYIKSDRKFILSYRQYINTLNAKLNPICQLLALLQSHHILRISRITVRLSLSSDFCMILYWWRFYTNRVFHLNIIPVVSEFPVSEPHQFKICVSSWSLHKW